MDKINAKEIDKILNKYKSGDSSEDIEGKNIESDSINTNDSIKNKKYTYLHALCTNLSILFFRQTKQLFHLSRF